MPVDRLIAAMSGPSAGPAPPDPLSGAVQLVSAELDRPGSVPPAELERALGLALGSGGGGAEQPPAPEAPPQEGGGSRLGRNLAAAGVLGLSLMPAGRLARAMFASAPRAIASSAAMGAAGAYATAPAEAQAPPPPAAEPEGVGARARCRGAHPGATGAGQRGA